MDSRLTLHYLGDICEAQRAAIQDWIEALNSWLETEVLSSKDLELVKVRSQNRKRLVVNGNIHGFIGCVSGCWTLNDRCSWLIVQSKIVVDAFVNMFS